MKLKLLKLQAMIGEKICSNNISEKSIFHFRSVRSRRDEKALLSFLFIEKPLLKRIDSLEEIVNKDHRKAESLVSSISDIYEKIERNKKTLNEKCSKNKLNRVLKTIEKLETSIARIEDTNVIALEHLVKMIRGSARSEINSKMLDFE